MSIIGKPVAIYVPETARVVSRQVTDNPSIPIPGPLLPETRSKQFAALSGSVTIDEYLDTNRDGVADVKRRTHADYEGGRPWNGATYSFLDGRDLVFKDTNEDGLIDEFTTGNWSDEASPYEEWIDANCDGKTDSLWRRTPTNDGTGFSFLYLLDFDRDGVYDYKTEGIKNHPGPELEVSIPVSEME